MRLRFGRRKRHPPTFVFPAGAGKEVDGSIDVDLSEETFPLQSPRKHAHDASTGSNHKEEEKEDGNNLERTTVRIDGLEVYAVVSALTSATSIQCFEAFNVAGFMTLWQNEQYMELACDVVFFIAGTTGIVAGLHATLIFSLMTMYSRTAIGMHRDDVLDAFFQRTAMQRYRGFHTFLHSMYAFLVQVTFLITSKCPNEVKMFTFLFTSLAIYMVYRDTQRIISAASMIFQPKVDKKKALSKAKSHHGRSRGLGHRQSSLLLPARPVGGSPNNNNNKR